MKRSVESRPFLSSRSFLSAAPPRKFYVVNTPEPHYCQKRGPQFRSTPKRFKNSNCFSTEPSYNQQFTPKRNAPQRFNRKRKISHQQGTTTITPTLRSSDTRLKDSPKPVQKSQSGGFTPMSKIWDRYNANWKSVANNAQGRN